MSETKDSLSFQSFPYETIYILGDSHSETYASRIYEVGARRYSFLAVQYTESKEFFNRPKRISANLVKALRRAGLLVATGSRAFEMLHQTESPQWRHVAIVRGVPLSDPAIVFTVASVEVLTFSSTSLAAYDRILNQGDLSKAGKTEISFEKAAGLFYVAMEPYVDAVRSLHDYGFKRLALLSLVPFSSIDSQFEAAVRNLVVNPRLEHLGREWRINLAKIANSVLERIANDLGVLFIDRHSGQTTNGLAAPGVLRDGIHVDDAARDLTALRIINAFDTDAQTVVLDEKPRAFQIYLDSACESRGLVQFTIDRAGFAQIENAESGRLVELRDINTGTVLWINSKHIVFAAPLSD